MDSKELDSKQMDELEKVGKYLALMAEIFKEEYPDLDIVMVIVSKDEENQHRGLVSSLHPSKVLPELESLVEHLNEGKVKRILKTAGKEERTKH